MAPGSRLRSLVRRARGRSTAWHGARLAALIAATATATAVPVPAHAGVALIAATATAVPAHAEAAGGFSYVPPANLARYPVGAAIRSAPDRHIAAVVLRAGRPLLFMYRSESATGAPRAETGVIIVPHGRPPAGGWPVIAWDHGTTGVGPACAASKSPLLGDQPSDYTDYLASFVRHGYVVVAPDYEGLGPPGEISPFAEMQSEGVSTIDAVRAARGIVAHLRRQWVVLGHSQGGQAALGTAQLAATRAPTLPLIGTVPMAPASDLGEVLDIVGNTKPPAVATLPEIAYLLLSVQVSDPLFNPASVVSSGMAAGLKLARTGCYAQLYAFYQHHLPARLFRGNWRSSQPLRLFASRNSPGTQLSPGPMLLAQGLADQTIPPALTAQLDRQLCSLGQPVDFRTYPGVTHNRITFASRADVLAWIKARFAGKPSPGNCPPPP
jgi:pimeloyl-ACP methyl ester carboxylesterase